jgi:methylenetetrahydrofolate reductase (NADPH)
VREGPDTPPDTNRVRDMLARARFEVVPIKGLEDQIQFLPDSAVVTVTCSPRLGIERTLDVCGRLAESGHRIVVPHLCARQVSGPAHLEDILQRLDAQRVEEVFVVGGDARDPSGPYICAVDLLRAMDELGHRFARVGIAGYPEPHPIVAQESLLASLRLKQPHADYIVSQICFDPDVVFVWVAALRGEGIRLPVYVGITGPLKRRKLLEISVRVGVGDSVRFIAKQGNLVARLAKRGGHRLDDFVAKVDSLLGAADRGVAGFHLNTFNQVESAERWRQRSLAAFDSSGAAG